ncbi:MAG: hypothetical protein AAFR87_00780 [Bacteroidota bacterium]
MPQSPEKKAYKVIYLIKASGKNGRRGLDGRDFPSNHYREESSKAKFHGDPGFHGEPGAHAKNVFISAEVWQKEFDPNPGSKLPIKLTIHFFNGEIPLDRKKVFLELGVGDKIEILARGGNGGKGGDGGYGLNTRTPRIYPTFGGDAGSGGNGGDGGHIRIEVPESQSYLLSYFVYDVSGGEGGKKGFGGKGGEYRNVNQLSGWNRRGKRGKNGTNGFKGREGKVEYQLTSKKINSPEIYKKLHDIEIERFEFQEAFPDGIYEFGEEVMIRHIGIKNLSDMPTPEEVPICLRIKENEWIKPSKAYLIIPPGMKERERKNFFDPISFQLRHVDPHLIQEDALIKEVSLEMEAFHPGSDLEFPLARIQHTIKVQYPVRLKYFRVIKSLAPGERGRISWRTLNLIGPEIDLAIHRQRRMQARFKLGEWKENLAQEQPLRLLDPLLKPMSIIDFRLFEVDREAEYKDSEFFLQVEGEAGELQDVKAELALELGAVDSPLKAKPIQIIPFHVRITQTYKKTEASDVLLVFHHDIDVPSLQEIKSFYKAIGSTIDYWDLSYYGFLDLEKRMEDGRSILEAFEGKTILILNFPFLNYQREEVLPSFFLKPAQFHRAVNEFGIEFLIIGESQWRQATFVQWFNLPTLPRKIYNRYRSVQDFLSFLDNRQHELGDGSDGFLKRPLGMLAFPEDNISHRSYEILIKKEELPRKYLSHYSDETLRVVCRHLAREMESRFPKEQFFFIYEYNKETIEGFWGKIEVKQGPHKVHGANMLAWHLERSIYEETHDKTTPSLGFFLYLSLSNWEFKEMLQEFLAGKPGFLETDRAIDDARDAILYRIVLEFINLKHFHSFSKDELKEQLGFFNMVFDHNIGGFDVRSPQTRLFGELCVHILAFIQSQKSTKEKLYLDKDDYRLSRLIQELLENWVDRNFDVSRELKRMDRKLWQRNKRDGKAFRNSLRERRQTRLRNYELKAIRERKSLAEAARQFYLRNVQNISVQTNSIYPRQKFEEICRQWNEVTKRFDEISQKEIEMLEMLKK